MSRMQAIFAAQRAAARRDVPSYEKRRAQLIALERVLAVNETEICRTIAADFGHRSFHETRMSDVLASINSVRYARTNLARWMRPQARRVSPWFWPATARVYRRPAGVVGIIAAWNYPVHLAIGPLAGALAAGNRAMLKLSEAVPQTSALVARLLGETFSSEDVAVVEGGIETGRAFAALPFDHLLFTGSTAVGRDIMRAAAANLTPVTLELGGKSPALVAPDAPLGNAARRIMWGKLFNAGQTCIAPDYALVPRERLDAFVTAASDAVRTLAPPALAAGRTTIVNGAHYARLRALLDDARAGGATVIELGGEASAAGRDFRPALVLGAREDARVMREEIFGPILPIVAYGTFEEALATIDRLPPPLAAYLFAQDAALRDRFLAAVPAGGVTIDDTLVHYMQDDLPFGGHRESGIGRYHGREGFETFSRAQGVFVQRGAGGFVGLDLLRPPYGIVADGLLRLMKIWF
jgi:coniferyl-aldehyde dehydrogenase